MSDEPETPSPEDDGWGQAAENLTPKEADETNQEAASNTEEAPAPSVDSEWGDPANLDERVAALRNKKEQPPSARTKAETEPPAVAAPKPRQTGALPIVEEGLADEDAPPWTAEPTEPLPSSDMLAAASVLAQKDFDEDPKTRKKVKTRKDKREKRARKQLTRRQQLFFVGGAAALVVAVVCSILGWLNSQNYYLVCGTKSIKAEQGRFWPWGQSPLEGPAFRAIKVPDDVLCSDLHFEAREELEQAFLSALLEQSTALLTSGKAEHVTTAEKQLEQALLLTRSPTRAKERTLTKRLQGDVSYWRGAAEIERAIELLQKGAEQFERAASMRPRHSSDANEWAKHARFIEAEIDKGPKSLRKDDSPKEQPHFQGLSQPTPRPEVPTTERSADAGLPSAPDAGPPPVPDAAPPPADAALPKGGVLL